MIGYESRYLIENAGSFPIYIVFSFLLQIIFVIVLLVTSTGKSHQFAKNKQSGFFWSGSHELYMNAYITLAMCVCINSSSHEFASTAVMVNNIIAGVIAVALFVLPAFIAIKSYSSWKEIGKMTVPSG